MKIKSTHTEKLKKFKEEGNRDKGRNYKKNVEKERAKNQK